MKRSFLLPLAFFHLLLVPCLVNADISVTMKLDRKEATPLDSIRMIVNVSGTRSSDSQPILNALESFSVTQGGTSSRLEIINGKINAGIDYTYFIQPKKTGTFRIGPAEVTVEGRIFRSNTVTLTIAEQPQSPGVDRGPLFLSAGLSPTKVYAEEQAIYTLKLYLQTKVSDISLDLPEIDHITFKQLGKPIEYKSLYNSKTYQVLEVRYALMPSRQGNYTIGPARMRLTVFQPRRRSRRSLFDDPFFSFSSGKPTTLASQPLELKVSPLPKEQRPAGFSGLVGTFQMKSKLEPSEIKAGESATLTVVLSGRGNVNRIPDLKFPELNHIKVYADQPVLQIEPDDKGIEGSKTMKWALVPEREGLYEIPPLTVSFFDTKNHQYRVIKTSPLAISVLPGEEKQVRASAAIGRGNAVEGSSKQAVKELGRDILPVHTSINDLGTGFLVRPGGLFFWVATLAPVLVYALAFCRIRFRRKSVSMLAETKAKKAARTFVKKCRHGEPPSSHLAAAISEYLNERFGLTLGSLTPDEAVEILRSRGVSLDTAHRFRAVLRKLEDAVYTGKGHESCDIGEDIARLIKQIEKEIR
ncbi:MAG: hypothetical protein BA872_02005 [Desulfobacterales bacterium C00003060]|nr:MAG: hypothetical protein BA861_00480 [Desulfobacterales bacterium S3730MH5]OEU78193.1 MAG: hypothetical protein BA872_02005 [Desulfobacterales bacterium C00003060]